MRNCRIRALCLMIRKQLDYTSTLTIEKIKPLLKSYRKTITEEHVVLFSAPHSQYIGHVAPRLGTASSIRNSIIEFLDIHMVDVSTLVAIGCDGTAANTGCKNGAIALIEK
nr:unnamed protein product [Callosobruchus analis]